MSRQGMHRGDGNLGRGGLKFCADVADEVFDTR
jgi:hypothetical protein